MRRLICALTGKHKWGKRLAEIPVDSVFYRVDCDRCGEAIDGSALRRLVSDMTDEQTAFTLAAIGMKP